MLAEQKIKKDIEASETQQKKEHLQVQSDFFLFFICFRFCFFVLFYFCFCFYFCFVFLVTYEATEKSGSMAG